MTDIIKPPQFEIDKVQVDPWVFNLLARAALMNSDLREELKAAEEKSFRDGLTEVMNRRFLEEKEIPRMARHIARSRHPNSSENERIFFGIADVDKMKHINDTFGHLKGDELLKRASATLGNCVRPDDTVGRFGGDEFYIIATISDDIIIEPSELTQLISKRCQQMLENYSDVDLKVSMAFVRVDDYKSPEVAIEEADAIMYYLKKQKSK